MPRRAYLADVESVKATELPNGIVEFKTGDDDGTFVFQYVGIGSEPISLQAMIPEVSDYPNEHSWFVYSTSDHVPASINKILDAADFAGLRIHPMLCKLATTLNKTASEDAASDEDSDVDFQESQSDDEEMADVFEEEAYDELRSQASDDDLTMQSLDDPDRNAFGPVILTDKQQELRRMIQADLRLAKKAGFRVSGAGPIFDGGLDCFIILACRVSKLGLQEDTLQAWHLDPRKYLLLILRYPEGYMTLEQALQRSNTNPVQLKIVLSNDFKLPYPQAVRMFVKTKNAGERHHAGPTKIEALFIDRPLNELLNQRLLLLLRHRQELGLGWRGAEDYFNDGQGKQVDSGQFVADSYYNEVDTAPPHLPAIATADHLADKTVRHSLPLAAMQLALRHLVRCTEFCLVCHSRVGNSFEALKPYVCSKPLCLYQYMSLGFGPSIESEIVSQPDVVDLLICFCYHAAAAFALSGTGPNKLPVGMGLTVPPYHEHVATATGLPSDFKSGNEIKTKVNTLHVHQGKLDEVKSELIFEEGAQITVKPGQWVYITGFGVCNQHRRVFEVWGNNLVLGPMVYANPRERELNPSLSSKGSQGVLSEREAKRIKTKEVHFVGWSQEFDALDATDQQRAVISLLNSLPSVQDMRSYVIEAGNKDGCLSEWKDRISPAALGLLRWIIASNRSCIVMVDSLDENEPREAGVIGLPPKYVQFRFAQGAPDKEQRFVEAVNDARKRLKSDFPTIFAWHGSPLMNWHSIIREGLHYREVHHGRAYGDGIYHALDIGVSTNYSRGVTGQRSGAYHGSVLAPYWPNSRLHLQSAICLNEIVNAPDEFQSKTPYLVVQHVDWVQTRYLFVSTMLQEESIRRKAPTTPLDQHSTLRPTAGSSSVTLPISAIPRSRAELVKPSKKRSRLLPFTIDLTKSSSEEDDSEESSAEDQALYSEAIRSTPAVKKDVKPQANQHSDFRPGTLDASRLPMIAAPGYATTQATKALQRELKKTLQVLDKDGTFALGWHLDRELVTNMYQWIFELHSFDPKLPLAQDLKSKRATSVVLEVRFGPNFPYAPPFVRIIKPRFLPFLQGGGGHVTHGGAMCMELLTNTGWNPATDIEALILQVRMALTSTDPQPARLEKGEVREYGIAEAAAAYRRSCELHGWKLPPDIDAITRQGQGAQFS